MVDPTRLLQADTEAHFGETDKRTDENASTTQSWLSQDRSLDARLQRAFGALGRQYGAMSTLQLSLAVFVLTAVAAAFGGYFGLSHWSLDTGTAAFTYLKGTARADQNLSDTDFGAQPRMETMIAVPRAGSHSTNMLSKDMLNEISVTLV